MDDNLNDWFNDNPDELFDSVFSEVLSSDFTKNTFIRFLIDINENEIDVLLAAIESEIFRLLKDEYIIIATSSYVESHQACFLAIDRVGKYICRMALFKYRVLYPNIRKILAQILIVGVLLEICTEFSKYTLGLRLYRYYVALVSCAKTYKPHPNAIGSFKRKQIAGLLASYIWEHDLSKILMPIQVARMVKNMINLSQESETIVKWLHETNSIPDEIKLKISENCIPRKSLDTEQQELLIELIHKKIINDLSKNKTLM